MAHLALGLVRIGSLRKTRSNRNYDHSKQCRLRPDSSSLSTPPVFYPAFGISPGKFSFELIARMVSFYVN